MAVTESASALITSLALFTCDWILCPSFKQQKESCLSLPSYLLPQVWLSKQAMACKEGRKPENRVKSEFSCLPKCRYSLNLDTSPSCLAYREDSHISLQHIFITLNVSFTNEGTNQWGLHQVSMMPNRFFKGKCHTPLCVVAHRTLTRPLCHSLGFGYLLGAGDQMQPFHNWLRSWVVLLGNGADERNEHICSLFSSDRRHH